MQRAEIEQAFMRAFNRAVGQSLTIQGADPTGGKQGFSTMTGIVEHVGPNGLTLRVSRAGGDYRVFFSWVDFYAGHARCEGEWEAVVDRIRVQLMPALPSVDL
ncbi:hypothetical protein TPY_2715 [Sulfobacillus acidophilus TPY]|uniref:Uncharacterized protein n=1 Tax=Sulfobacillus acidophilus (strain ATCC 700253 / DSM 10332 / NAL) TaxID=679936 RepID=G8TUL8_SULAD|nr:hypothetical protein TPY_2715 [Sulfobacillus acidophilus TPY]AEW04665.1 hypothetical protein Sulac_1165 [Sulfobacillus acidophilus DSM 10332]